MRKRQALRTAFLGALHAQGVKLVPDRWERSLENFEAGDPTVRAAAEAATLEQCFPFMETLVGSSYNHVLRSLHATL